MNTFEWTQETPVTANNLNEMQNIINQNISDEIDSKSKLLWTNPYPTSQFLPQTITLNSDDYDVLEIFFKKTATETYCSSIRTIKGYGTHLCLIDDSLAMFSRKMEYVSDTSVSFTKAIIVAYGANPQDQNTRCVPLYIVGHKTGLFS